MKRMVTLFAALLLIATTAAQAEELPDEFKIGEVYNVGFAGCKAKEVSDLIAKRAKEKGSALDAWTLAEQRYLCGLTRGDTRVLEIYETFEDSATTPTTLWYIRYEVQLEDKTWKTFWGFTFWAPEGTALKSNFKCERDCA